jgi:hypothetical protein
VCWPRPTRCQRTRTCLPPNNDYLDHNELELAFDELESIGDEAHAAAPFWAELAQAAENMGLTQHAARCRQRVKDEVHDGS